MLSQRPGRQPQRFDQLGFTLAVLEPDKPSGIYHAESSQENFLVLAGTCLLLIEEQEHRLRAWDFVHCPPHTRHIFVGAGDGPCVIFMTGARREDDTLLYPVSEVAAAHGASVAEETPAPAAAYQRFPKWRVGRPNAWEQLPWN